MKRKWTPEELISDWTLQASEWEIVNQARTEKNRLGLALLLKWFQLENRFCQARSEMSAESRYRKSPESRTKSPLFRGEGDWQFGNCECTKTSESVIN